MCVNFPQLPIKINNIEFSCHPSLAEFVFLTTGTAVLDNAITGVALVKAEDEISFYFGCVTLPTNMRGAGLFVGSADHSSARSVYELRGNDSETAGVIGAGALYRSDSDMCDVEAIWSKITGSNIAVCHVSPHWSAAAIASLLSFLFMTMKSC